MTRLNPRWPAASLVACFLIASTLFAADDPTSRLAAGVPRSPAECTQARTRQLAAIAESIETWAADRTWNIEQPSPEEVLQTIGELIAAKQQVDVELRSILSLRTRFASEVADGPPPREQLRQYLRCTSQLIDLAGRLRYLLRDAIDNATYDLSPYPGPLDTLIDTLTTQRVGIGAMVMTYTLFDPDTATGLQPFSSRSKKKVLQLCAATRELEILPDLAAFVQNADTPPELVVLAADAIRQIGLPQNPVPAELHRGPQSPPAITAAQLYESLERVDAAGLSPALAQRRHELLIWLDERAKFGAAGETFRVGNVEVRAGDWLLMRNPSPYNSFTDLAPGLFTHVGVVAVHNGADGIRRFVIVDLPERGDRVPITNVDDYLRRTLHYFFLRHDDPAVGRKMGEVAASLVGVETQFDLTFRTDRVLAYQGKLAEQPRLNTYCAGFLLVCAQETAAPRDDFFPIPEYPAGGHCLENLKQLGISIGDNFVSPTGAVFSPHLELVGRCEPMYSPDREIKEAIYDHFAASLTNKKLIPAPDTFQALRVKVVTLSKDNPWLARAIAKANNVSEHMDLEAAAKTAAVIETLDEIADSDADEFVAARDAILASSTAELENQGLQREAIARILMYRRRHADLTAGWNDGSLSPRQLRIELVRYYSQRGTRSLDERFFRVE